MKLSHFEVGPLRVRWEVPLLGAVLAFLGTPRLAAAFLVVLALHELGHALAAFWAKAPFVWWLQLSGAGPYVRELRGMAAVAVLLAGPATGIVVVGVALCAFQFEATRPWARDLGYAGILWNGWQLLPFPPLDGGQLLLPRLLDRGVSATWAWRSGWIAGLVLAVSVALLFPNQLGPVIWLTAMVLILGRADAGYVRHFDAYRAFERGDHRQVLARVGGMPDFMDRQDAQRLLALGLASAYELEDPAAVEALAARLPAAHPVALGAATWLLLRKQAYGGRLAEWALDAWDAERVKGSVERGVWADLCFYYAVFEASEQRFESALGLLERAVGFGFDHGARLEAEPTFERLKEHPRFLAVMERFS